MPDDNALRREIFAAAPGLAVSERLFDSALDAVFCIKNRRRQYVSANGAFLARVRVSERSALLGRTAREIFPPLLAAGYEQQDDTVFSTGQEIRDKLEMVTNPDGSTGWYLAHKVPVRDSRGSVIGLAGVSRDLRSPADSDPRLKALAGAIDTIQDDFAQPLRIEKLAKNAGMSLSQFERRVRALLRVSPRQLLTKMRVDAAARALRDSTEALGKISVNCGFYDQAMLSRQFRHATGLTPRQYRMASG